MNSIKCSQPLQSPKQDGNTLMKLKLNLSNGAELWFKMLFTDFTADILLQKLNQMLIMFVVSLKCVIDSSNGSDRSGIRLMSLIKSGIRI